MNSNEKPYAILREAHKVPHSSKQKYIQIQLVSFEMSFQVILTSGLSTIWFKNHANFTSPCSVAVFRKTLTDSKSITN